MRLAFVLVLASLLAAPSAGAEPVTAKHRFTVDDMWAVKRVGAPVVSPDGSLVAYTVSTWDADENRSNADIWLTPVAGGPRPAPHHQQGFGHLGGLQPRREAHRLRVEA